MWLSAENTSVPAGSPVSTSGAGCLFFGAPRPSAGYVSVLELPDMPCLPVGGLNLLRCRSNGQRGALPTCYGVVQTAAMTRWDDAVSRAEHDAVDVVVVGSGGGGLTAALAAA